MKELPLYGLAKGQVALVDDEDYDRVSGYRWSAVRTSNSSTLYIARMIQTGAKWKRLLLHRVVTDAPPGMDVHHINRNTFDNQRANLQVLDRQAHGREHRIEAEGRGSTMSFLVTPSDERFLREQAKARGLSLSALLREMVDFYREKGGDAGT